MASDGTISRRSAVPPRPKQRYTPLPSPPLLYCLTGSLPPLHWEQIWKAWDGKRWDDQPTLRCTAQTEAALEQARQPPPALLLECSKTLGLDSTAACLGWYRLTPDPRPANGSTQTATPTPTATATATPTPMGMATPAAATATATATATAIAKPMATAGAHAHAPYAPAGVANVHDAEADADASDGSDSALEMGSMPEIGSTPGVGSSSEIGSSAEKGASSGTGASPGFGSSSGTGASPGIGSSSGIGDGAGPRAFWVHTVHEDRWIGFADASWWCQGKANLGDAKGWLHLPCVSCFTPPGSRQVSGLC
jgi:hypothetical protein